MDSDLDGRQALDGHAEARQEGVTVASVSSSKERGFRLFYFAHQVAKLYKCSSFLSSQLAVTAVFFVVITGAEV